MKTLIALVGLLVVLGACTSYSRVMPLKDGTYVITAASAYSRSDVRESAGEKADDFCAQRHERVELVDATDGTRFTGPTQTTIAFRCVSRATPEPGAK